MKTNTTTRSAFSLVELLVVLAVMGILMGVTTTYVAGAKARARSVECQKNLGDWSKGLSMLLDASRTHAFPAAGSGAREEKSAWYNAIPRHMGQKALSDYGEGDRIPAPNGGIKSVYVCPEAVGRDAKGIFSYSYNKHLVNGGKSLRAPQVKRASELVVFMDAPRATLCAADEADVISDRSESFRHGGRMNIAFCDGHVASFKLPEVKQGAESPTEANDAGIQWDPWEETGEGEGSK